MSTFSRMSRNRAFTLIELLIVIVVIAILLAVAAPSFLGQQDKAKDSSTKQALAVAYKAAKADSVGQNSAAQGQYRTGVALTRAIRSSEPQMADRFITVPPEADVVGKGQFGVCPTSTAAQVRIVGTADSMHSFLMTSDEAGVRLERGTCAGANPLAVGASAPVADDTLACADGSTLTSGYERAIVRTDGLVHFWRFNETSGSTMRDCAGTSDGTYFPGAALTQGGYNSPGAGRSVRFDGTSTSRATADIILPSSAYTLAFSFRPRDLSGPNPALGYMLGNPGNVTRGDSFFFLSGGSTVVQAFGIDAANSVNASGAVGTGMTANQWYHVIVTRDSAASPEVTVFVNGANIVFSHYGDMVDTAALNLMLQLGVSNYDSSSRIDADYDDFAVFDRALTLSERTALFSSR